jgi:hypothetical protein
MRHLCPVCGYWDLPRPAQDDLICPCCGTHFGYHDYATTYDELRRKWIAKGAPWFSRALRPPAEWNALKQLTEARMLPFESVGGSREENRTDLRPNTPFSWILAATA